MAGKRAAWPPQPWIALIARTAIESVRTVGVEEAPGGSGGPLLVSHKSLVDPAGKLNRPAQEPKLKGFKAVDDGLGQGLAASTPQEGGSYGRVETPQAGLKGDAPAGELGAPGEEVALGLGDPMLDGTSRGGGGVHLNTQDRHVYDTRDAEGSPLTVQDKKPSVRSACACWRAARLARRQRLPGFQPRELSPRA